MTLGDLAAYALFAALLAWPVWLIWSLLGMAASEVGIGRIRMLLGWLAWSCVGSALYGLPVALGSGAGLLACQVGWPMAGWIAAWLVVMVASAVVTFKLARRLGFTRDRSI